jgi:rhodanese-related sulfurtransferase
MKRRNKHFGYPSVYHGKYSALRKLILFTALFTTSTSAVLARNTPDLTRQKIVVPEKIAGVNTVDAEQVIDVLNSDQPPLLIDARVDLDRDFGYIESSISLPDTETNCDSLGKIAADKNQHLMFYCNGVQCGRSVVSIKIALSCGYHRLSWFKGGFAEWKEKGYQYVIDR